MWNLPTKLFGERNTLNEAAHLLSVICIETQLEDLVELKWLDSWVWISLETDDKFSIEVRFCKADNMLFMIGCHISPQRIGGEQMFLIKNIIVSGAYPNFSQSNPNQPSVSAMCGEGVFQRRRDFFLSE